MGIYIRGMEMPRSCMECRLCNKPTFDFSAYCSAKVRDIQNWEIKQDWCPLIEVPPHGRLIDADALRRAMYHEAFETDSPMQKWDSGCWIRYKMFENMEETAPTIIEAEEGET